MRSSQQARKNAGILREETYLRLIQQRYDALSDRERRVADILLLHTHDQNLEFSISSLAQAAGVSEATVTRFSRSLGFSGFREFKYHAMKHEPQYSLNSGTQVTETDTTETVSQKVVSLIDRMTRLTVEGLDPAVVDEAVRRLCGAETILFVGGGSAAGISASAAAVFQYLDMKSLYIADDLLMFRYIGMMTEKDAVVCISNEGYLKSVVDAVMLARRRKVTTIVITGTSESLVTRYADCTLLTSSEGYGGTTDLFAMLATEVAVLNVLQMGCTIQLGKKAQESRLRATRMTEMKRYDLGTEAVDIKRIRQ